MRTSLTLLIFLFAFSAILQAQDPSAIADFESTEKGMLIPRMSSAERAAISAPAIGLLVYDTSTKSFWFFKDGSAGWTEIGASGGGTTFLIQDADGDTRVNAEESSDEDFIRFDLAGVERMVLDTNVNGHTRLQLIDTGQNMFFGKSAGQNTTGNLNTFMGLRAGEDNTTGYENHFIGAYAGRKNTTGLRNMFIGMEAGRNNQSSSYNMFIGYQAGLYHLLGDNNTYIGRSAGELDSAGYENTFVGSLAGTDNKTGYANVFLGMYAGHENTSGFENVFVGRSAGLFNSSGLRNTFVGAHAGRDNADGNYNTFIGVYAGDKHLSGDNNTYLGRSAGGLDSVGFANTFLGALSGYKNKTGYSNVFAGMYAGWQNDSGRQNVFIGKDAGRFNLSGAGNTFVGHQAGFENETGDYNTFVGDQAGQNHVSGSYNVHLGRGAGEFDSVGVSNTFIGAFTGYRNKSGNYNTSVGMRAGRDNETGAYNTFMGIYSGERHLSGDNNTYVGRSAGQTDSAGVANTFIGALSGYSNRTGQYNTFVGMYSGQLHSNGLENTFLGYRAGNSNISGSGNVFIGASAGSNETGSNKLYIANSSTASPLIYGEFDNSLVEINGQLRILKNANALRLEGTDHTYLSFYPDGATAGRKAWFGFGSAGTSDITINNDETGGDIELSTQGNSRINILSNGNVGIGETNPSEKLVVTGTIHSSTGGFKFPDGSVQTTAATGSGGSDNLGNHTATEALKMANFKIQNLANPTAAQDAATKNYVDANDDVNDADANPNNETITSAVLSGTNLQITEAGTLHTVNLSSLGGDNLGNHIATQNIRLNGRYLSGDGGNEGVYVTNTGNVGVGTNSPLSKFHVDGKLTVTGSDFAERFHVNTKETVGKEALKGMLMVIDEKNAGQLRPCTNAYDKKVAGIVSGAGNVRTGLVMGEPNTLADGDTPIALTGRVYCFADASYGAIQVGDLLTTSPTEGHAMKAKKFKKSQGAVIGKAMTGLEKGKGLVLVLINPQ